MASPTPAAARRCLPVLLLVLACAIAGCGGDDDGVVSTVGGGVISGRVTSPGYEGLVQLQVFSESGGDQLRVYQEASSTGTFSFSLPFGTYRLLCNAGNSPAWYSASGPVVRVDADTLVLAPGREQIEADFEFGAINLRVEAPGLLRTELFECVVQSDDSGYRMTEPEIAPYEDSLAVTIPFVPPGTHRISLVTPDGQVLALPYGEGSTGTRVNVEAGRIREVAYTLPAPSRIHGTVQGSWQRVGGYLWHANRPDVLLRIPDPASPAGIFTTAKGTVDESGAYSLLAYGEEVLPWITIGSVGRGLRDFRFPGIGFSIGPGQSVPAPDYLECGMLLRLQLPGDALTTSARVEVMDAEGEVRAETQVASGNMVAVCNLLPGNYFVHVYPRGPACDFEWLDTWFDGADSPRQATPVTIADWGDAVTVDLRLRPGGSISGVFGPEGAVSPGGFTIARAAEDSNAVRCAGDIVDADGHVFRFRALPDGSYRMRARITIEGQERNWWYPGTPNVRSAAVISIHDHQQVENLTWTLPS